MTSSMLLLNLKKATIGAQISVMTSALSRMNLISFTLINGKAAIEKPKKQCP